MEPNEFTVAVDFPGDIDYIPDVRRFLSNLISLRSFSRRYSFRMEIIIDELCSNAVKFGRLKVGEFIRLSCRIQDECVTLDVTNPGSDEKDVKNLKKAMLTSDSNDGTLDDDIAGRGIQIIKILSTSVMVLEHEGTTVRVIKKKNDNEDL